MLHAERLKHVISALESHSSDPDLLHEALNLLQSQLNLQLAHSEELRRHKERLDLALDAANVGIWDWDLASGRLTWNHHHAAIFGLQPAEFDGHYSAFERHLHPDDREKVAGWIGEAITRKTTYDHEFRILRPDGQVRWVHGRGRCTYDLADRPLRMIGTLVDVTDRVLAHEHERAKDHFLATLSHELRNPLTPILNTAQVLDADDSLAPRQRDLITLILRNAELEARLLDDLLDLTRIERGKLPLDVATADLHEQAEYAAAMFEADARTKNITLTLGLDAPRHHVQGDRARLLQILANLIKNAVKFTPIGGSVRVSSRNRDDIVEIAVADSGVGIPRDLLSRLFQPFEQGGAGITRQFGGLGLGLAISKGLAEMHGGALLADSPGKGLGATFTLSLPAVAPPRLTPSSPQFQPAVPNDGSCHVLLVEDHADTARLMKTVLAGFGCDVTIAHTVANASAALERDAFDLLLCDIGLPDGSGTDVMAAAARLRPDLHGVALSGYGMPADIETSKRAGFLAHLTKPVDLVALHQLILQHWQPPAAL